MDFHPEPIVELSESADWYAERSPASARNFFAAVDKTIALIAVDPLRFVLIDEKHRACSVTKFPFQIVFRVDRDRMLILAVAHAKRRPAYWKNR